MSSQKHIQDELWSLGSSLSFNNNQPYSVPEGYFEGLAASVLAKVKSMEGSVQAELEQLSPLLAGIPKRTPYSVPTSYFEDSLDHIGALNEATSPVLAAVGKNLPYAVPQGYFEALPDQVLTKVSKPKAKVVPLFARTWMRVAAAATVAGVLFFGGYQLLSGTGEGPQDLAGQLPADTTQQQVASNQQPIRKEMKQVSTQELEDFIETVQVKTPPKAARKPAREEETAVEDLLKDVSTSEMERFLATMPTIDDDLLITD